MAPTSNTAWLIEAAQLLKTPPVYLLQLLASTVTEIGLPAKALWMAGHPWAEAYDPNLKLPPFLAQFWLTALYGYSDYEAIPAALT